MRDRPNDQHRKVAAKKLGRPLHKGEDVSHNDDNKANNDPSNLTVMSHSAHSRHTATTGSLRKLRKALTMHHRGEKLYAFLLALLLLGTPACHPRITIYPPSACYDLDSAGNRWPINMHSPTVERVCIAP